MVNKKAKNAKVRSTKERSPNFFLGVRIQSPPLLTRLQEIQEHFCKQDPTINKCLIPASKFHITLFVLYLETNEQITIANRILEESRDLIAEFHRETNAEILLTGIGQFGGNSVIYSGLPEHNSTTKFQDLVSRLYHRFLAAEPSLVLSHEIPLDAIGKRGYQANAIYGKPPTVEPNPYLLADELPMSLFAFSHRPEEPGPQWNWAEHRQAIAGASPHRHQMMKKLRSFEFTPHVTLFKARGPKERKIMKQHFVPSAYAHLLDQNHGTEPLHSIDLLEMRGSKTGFYERYSSVVFGHASASVAEGARKFLVVEQLSCPRLEGNPPPKR
eukprot:TRINITY_DN1399_c0_g1_i3.p1 TRINITY_DN1399_c0_g1~~TRINITY_DN1399_c0_g1_i3.p1  ORF type:complete len:328 (-),score=41.06 TRINITY_DN1399_c0_g1_i3:1436-2419(-)